MGAGLSQEGGGGGGEEGGGGGGGGGSSQLMRREPKRLPHNYQAIMKEADSPLDSSSDDLHDRLHSGVLLNQKKKKYWVDKNSGHNCFMLFAKDLSITWSEDPRYWRWLCMDETSGNAVEVAELLNVCWLEVHGKLKTSNLSPGITYEIAFVVMMKEQRYGWDVPVTLRFEGPNGQVQEHTECLKDKPRGQWIELHVGDFTAPGEKEGDLQFCLIEYKVGIWKRGLVIKGAIVQPKK